MKKEPPLQGRIPVIDLVRFVSILLVIGGHFFPRWVAGQSGPGWLRELVLGTFLNGSYGVCSFFVVSGFLITRMLAEGKQELSRLDLKGFYIRRVARIFPLLGLVVLCGLFLSLVVPGLAHPWRKYDLWVMGSGFGVDFWGHLLSFTFNWFVTLEQHSVPIGMGWILLWSLAVEEQFYFFYPVALKSLVRPRRIVAFLVLIIISGPLFRAWAYRHFGDDLGWGYMASFAVFDQLAMGSLLFFVWKGIRAELERRPRTALALMATGATILLMVHFTTSIDSGAQRVLALSLLALGCALFILGGLHVPFMGDPWMRWLSWPGKLSYGCYLWHPAVLFFMLPLLAKVGGIPALLLLFLSVVLFAYASYRWFELPVNDLIRGWFGLKPSRSL